MELYSDSADFLKRLSDSIDSILVAEKSTLPNYLPQFFSDSKIYRSEIHSNLKYPVMIINEFSSHSQFDLILSLIKDYNNLPDGLICLTGSGTGQHGFRGREWISLEGNIHLSILFQPQRKLKKVHPGFLILAVNAVVQTINDLVHFKNKAQNRWVNDIMIGRLKVGGILVQSQMQGETTDSVVIGIGLNVNKSPVIEEDPIIRGTVSINDFMEGNSRVDIKNVLWDLLSNIENNYLTLMAGDYQRLFNYYYNHSSILGEEIEVFSDPREGMSQLIAHGKVMSITEDLEIILDHYTDPIRKGRIRLKQ